MLLNHSNHCLLDCPQLVAGSGTTQSQDEADNAPLDDNTTHAGEAKHDDGYSAGVPGPLTRLFVIANRGIANLIQDLILVSGLTQGSILGPIILKFIIEGNMSNLCK